MNTSVALLPKVRSDALRQSCGAMPCSLRIGTFIGLPCAGHDTVVGAHVGSLGKAMGSKVSDLFIVAACQTCHDLIDRRDSRWEILADKYPAAVIERVLAGLQETQSRWIQIGAILVPDAEII